MEQNLYMSILSHSKILKIIVVDGAIVLGVIALAVIGIGTVWIKLTS